ncbi:MAG: glycosyltransferase [Gemmatimonadales bacterium]|nr:glycosyltransferase [Gemmatimonadales bacterium]MDQ3426212.1 glycosyltransferase [Gemmatimonadota bacterium]
MSPIDLLPALLWLLPFGGLMRLARATPNLSDAPVHTGTKVSVIIPARNESATIETVVRSILESTYQPFELLVVDDRSTDDTAALVERLACGEPRLRLIRGEALPQGWYGKPWACLQGYRAATGELLLFTDADTRHRPELLAHAAGALRHEGVDLVTVSPHQRCVTFWERLIMPQIWLLLGVRYHPRRVNRASRGRDVIANGQFILVTREAYESVGTHAAVGHEVVEDLALAQTFLRGGRKMHFAFAERLMETRMYHSLPHLVEGWSKNIYLGGRRSFPDEPILRALVPVILAVALLFWLAPPAVLAITGGSGVIGHAAAAATVLSAIFWMLINVGMQIPLAYGLGYPLGAAMALFIVARSTWRGSRRVEWRGRVYRKQEQEGG